MLRPMNERVRKLSEEIRRLSPEEQADLLDEILVNLDQASPAETDKAWLIEIKRRVAAYDRGEIVARDAREALGKYK